MPEELVAITKELRRRGERLKSRPDTQALQDYADAQLQANKLATSGYIPVTWDKTDKKEKDMLRYRADVALNDLERAMWLDVESPWTGEDYDTLEPLPKRLLHYMTGRPAANVDDVIEELWLGAAVSPASFANVVSKVNTFLRKRQHPDHLKNVYGYQRWVSEK